MRNRAGKGSDNLPLVGKGVSRLVKWTDGKKAGVELPGVHVDQRQGEADAQAGEGGGLAVDRARLARAAVLRAPVSSRSLDEHALLDDPEMLAAVTAMNRQIQELAPNLEIRPGRHKLEDSWPRRRGDKSD